MAKGRKKVFPKKPVAWTTKEAEKLGRGSNFSPEVNLLAIYNSPKRKEDKYDRRSFLKRYFKQF